jgi:hypothetical protein
MKTIEMDLTERQHCVLILSEQKTNPLDSQILFNIYSKIKMSRTEELQTGLKFQSGVGWTWTMPEGTEPVTVELEDEEARKLHAILTSWTGYGMFDSAWNNPLIKKLV